VGWQLSQMLELTFMFRAVEGALLQAVPHIWNSDQEGSHFTSPNYLDRLLAAQVKISMDGRERVMENIFPERLVAYYQVRRSLSPRVRQSEGG
jgi:putative transposase